MPGSSTTEGPPMTNRYVTTGSRWIAVALLLIFLAGSAVGAQPRSPQLPAVNLADLFARVAPSVVVIRARGREVSSRQRGVVAFNETGAGVLISPDGTVLTAAHVVHAMDEISVELASGEELAARVIASEPAADIALLELAAAPREAAVSPLVDSDRVRVAEPVMVVGAPYGLSRSVSVGWISGRYPPNTIYGAFPLAEFLQTDAAINTGNSGGPMFNMAGEVIGVVSHIISKSGGSEGLGFVVSSRTIRDLLLEGRAYWTGAEFHTLTPEQAAVLNVPQSSGLLLKGLASGSPLEAAGLRGGSTAATIDGQPLILGGDVILAVADMTIGTPEDVMKIREQLRRLPPGAEVVVKAYRAGRTFQVVLRLH
jgi:S1-C subfamily serine protease